MVNTKKKPRKIDSREDLKIVTDNKLITARRLNRLSLKARKMFYLTMAQCRQDDDEFYVYEITPAELARKFGIDSCEVYRLADDITRELMSQYIEVKEIGAKRFKKYAIYCMCEYDESSVLRFKLNPDMAEFLLGLKKSFTQVFLSDFLKMRSAHSMAVWHLMQREMNGRKPGTDRITFYLSLEELREVTGTQDKLKQISQFKERVLDKAIRDIKDNCGVTITYENQRRGRNIVGFLFTAYGNIDLTDYHPSQKALELVRKYELESMARKKKLTPAEFDELQELVLKYNQVSLFDFYK